MTRVVFITQQFDPGDPNLAIVVPQVAALARRVDEVVVVADTIVAASLPPNARAHSFRSKTKLGRGLRLLLIVARELPGLRRGGAVVAHMCPVYAIVVAPLVRPARVPLVLWWSHWKMDAVVRTAERVCTRVVSVAPGTFPHPSAKLVTVGQAIDVDSFPERSGERVDGPLRALVIGRYSAAKGVATVLRALRLATDRGADVQLDVYGPASNTEARAERDALQRLVGELGLGERVRLHGAVSRGEVIRLLGTADLLVNNAPGGADRVVYEAGASGIPVLASNPAHADFLEPGAFFDRDDAEELAGRLAALAALPAAARDETGRLLRDRVARGNSVDSWAAGLLEAAGIPGRDPTAAGGRPDGS